ncbi:hypothetical protein ACJ73_09892 [Blastomyces percursus]|uniref:Uncharacterized protein n=1 Tax=Blastomyces percursus TaxID=1658174 RepID=A0A1J9Q4W8_9EURO|nr:hypothetical protein ACJ73_09892 [Blastomyces percursus]
MLKKALSFELLKTLTGGGRRYNPATNAPATQKDPDAMEWVDSNVYAQRRVSATRPSYRVTEFPVCPTKERPIDVVAEFASTANAQAISRPTANSTTFLPAVRRRSASTTPLWRESSDYEEDVPAKAQKQGKD